MINYTINIGVVEELQMLKDMPELNRIFSKAKSTVIQGGTVAINRTNSDGSIYTTDEISSEADLKAYQEKIFKYLS